MTDILSTQNEWPALVARYGDIESALADYYDCTGSFAPYSQPTRDILEFCQLNEVRGSRALEMIFGLYKAHAFRGT